MPCCQITIPNKLGLHARAAAKFVSTASRYPCNVRVGREGEALVDGKNIMAVMMLAASQGTRLQLDIQGEQAHKALADLIALIENFFEEDG